MGAVVGVKSAFFTLILGMGVRIGLCKSVGGLGVGRMGYVGAEWARMGVSVNSDVGMSSPADVGVVMGDLEDVGDADKTMGVVVGVAMETDKGETVG